MLGTDTVCRAAHPDGERCHSKALVVIREIRTTKSKEFTRSEFQRVDILEAKALGQIVLCKNIISRRDRGVSRENAFLANDSSSLGKGAFGIFLQVFSREFECEE